MPDKFNEYLKAGAGVQEASCRVESDYIQENRRFAANHRAKCAMERKEMQDKLRKLYAEQERGFVTVRY